MNKLTVCRIISFVLVAIIAMSSVISIMPVAKLNTQMITEAEYGGIVSIS